MAMTIAPWRLVPGTAQKVAYTATAGTSAAVGPQCRAVLVAVTSDAHIRVGPPGLAAAVATDMLIKAAWPPMVLGIAAGEEISVVQDAAAGSLYLQELTH